MPPGVREKLLATLAAVGPSGLGFTRLVERAGVHQPTAGAALKHEWFRKSDPAVIRSPWVLTEAGEKAASSTRTGATPAAPT